MGIVLVLATSAALAGRPLATDDAGTTPLGSCQLESWFERFEISGNIETRILDFNIYQGGLVLDFAMSGTDDGTTKAMQDVTAAAVEGKGLAKAVQQLQKTLGKQEDAVRDHLRKVTSI